MHKTLVVGDIHGCYAEFQDLLDRAALGAGDRIVAVGDIVDRGPESPRVLEFFRERPNAATIMGNHERKHVRAFRGAIPPAPSQVIARAQIGDIDYPGAVEWMAGLPRALDLPDALIVHGFWEPGVALEDQRDVVLIGTMTGETYIEDNYPRPWWANYDGDKPLIVGHHNYTKTDAPLIYADRVYGIDTGCVYGGALTGLILPDFRIVSVPSRGDHWAALKAQSIRSGLIDPE
ncbi:MAG: hypothetical protein GYB67_19225 [Chloroflexi bacterium]|nr:hypothetical protein [Chloroflexota bacterium]